ncbi:phosphoglucosamine mutase [Gammaproteobacteria bacterium]|nr:phosphoglucosamine mutase [Gammaproteobacteria bacterium]
MTRQYFGTDGIRGRVGVHPITPDFVLKLGYAVGRVLAKEGAQMCIGKDTRLSGYMFESALEAGLSYAGVDVAMLGPIPTPGIAYLTQTLDMLGGCVVSASHNPYYDNGIKFFGATGEKLDDEIESKIEEILDQPLKCVDPDKLGKARRISDAAGRYIEFCKSSARTLDLRGLTIVLDCANGATYHVAPCVFRELGAKVITIGNSPDGLNINDGYGSTSPENLIKKVLAEKADFGIGFDGDGDRVAMVGADGTLYDGDDLLYILAIHRKERAVVGTLMSNLGFEHALKTQGIDLIRAKVGDRYVLEQMKANNLLLGGENSGHILCMDKHCTGDGIIASLQVLIALNASGLSFKEALANLNKYAQIMINVTIEKGAVWDTPKLQAHIAKLTHNLNNTGRILIRASGTEPVVRVMAEALDQTLAKSTVADLVKMIQG